MDALAPNRHAGTRRLLLAGTLGTLFVAAGALRSGAAPATLERARFLMGTTCRAVVHHEDPAGARSALVAAFDAIAALEDELSTWRPDSTLSLANRLAGRRPVPVSPALAELLDGALGLAELTGGAFDPTVGPLVRAWDLRGSGRVPGPGELAATLPHVGHHLVDLDRGAGLLSLGSSRACLDAGAFGKGAALDRARDVLVAAGVRSALMDFGGQLLLVGAPPGDDAWRVAVADPTDRERPAVELLVRDASVATSAQSERRLLVDGVSVGHVLDPRTGRPVPGRHGVTVVAPDGLTADALATALLVMGPDAGRRWCLARPQSPAALWLEPRPHGLDLTATKPAWALVSGVRADIRAHARPLR